MHVLMYMNVWGVIVHSLITNPKYLGEYCVPMHCTHVPTVR